MSQVSSGALLRCKDTKLFPIPQHPEGYREGYHEGYHICNLLSLSLLQPPLSTSS